MMIYAIDSVYTRDWLLAKISWTVRVALVNTDMLTEEG